MNRKIGLVLEGGGFRGLFTAGILHYFQENGIEFPYIVAVSMGASNAANYLSKQTKRNLDIPYTFIKDKRYMSYSRLLRRGELFGMDFIFNDVPHHLIPFDFEAYKKSKLDLTFVTTDCEKGQPYYILNKNSQESFKALEASTSLPFAAKMVNLNGKLLLDGGICDPIPVKKALDDGCDKVVVILTQPRTYTKSPFKPGWVAKWKYANYPHLVSAILNRHEIYNQQLADINELEREGKAFVIRPESKLPVSRTERNKEKLKESFDIGLLTGERIKEELDLFLKNCQGI